MSDADKMTARQGLRLPLWLATLGCVGVLLYNVFIVADAGRNYDTNHKLLDSGVEVVGRVIAVESHDDWTQNRVEVDYTAADRGYDRWIGAREPGDDLPLVADRISLLYEPGHPTTVALEDLVNTGGYRSALVLSGIAIVLTVVAAAFVAIAAQRSTAPRPWKTIMPLPVTFVLAVAIGATALAYWQAGLSGAGTSG
jgi:hypothetical protein